MITVETPASFEWTEDSARWVRNYLLPKKKLFSQLINDTELDVELIDEQQFIHCCQLLEISAEGRELRNKMFKAWRSKKSRDSNNGKKLYTFNLSIKAGDQLKKIAQQRPLNKTLESLIFSENISEEQTKLKQIKNENTRLRQQLTELESKMNLEQNLESILSSDLEVNTLAKLEKSQLIKKILLLKRKINQ